jgi:hypothetical protein
MPSPLICQVWTTPAARAPWEREGDYLVVEIDAPDLDAVLAHLSAGRTLTARVLKTRGTADRGTRVVTARMAVGLTAAGIARISEWTGTLVEEAAA